MIVEDERPARRILRQLLEEYCEGVIVVGEAESLSRARELVDALRPNLVFLDVDLGAASGFGLVEEGMPPHTHIVFVTAYEQFALDAFRVDAVDYLLKPVDIDHLQEAVTRVRSHVTAVRPSAVQHAYAQPGGGRRYVAEDDIVRIVADGSYARLILEYEDELYVSKKIGQLDRELVGRNFLRVHRSHVVNLHFVRAIRRGWLTLHNGCEVPVSRGGTVALRERMAEFGRIGS